MTITELAARKGVTKQSMHQRVSKLVADGEIEIRKSGRNRLVDLAAYDLAVGQVGDAIREQGAETRRAAEPLATGTDRDRMRDAQLVAVQYANSKAAIELAKLSGELLPLKGPHGVETAALRIAETIVRIVSHTPLRHLEALETAAREDPAQHRRAIKAMCRDMRSAVAAALKELAGGALAEIEANGVVDISIAEPSTLERS